VRAKTMAHAFDSRLRRGTAKTPIQLTGDVMKIDKLVMKGVEQEGTAGYFFADFELSCTVKFSGAFAGGRNFD